MMDVLMENKGIFSEFPSYKSIDFCIFGGMNMRCMQHICIYYICIHTDVYESCVHDMFIYSIYIIFVAYPFISICIHLYIFTLA